MPPSDPNTAPPTNLAKAGMRLLKKLMLDERTVEPDNRRFEDRIAVAGEVTVLPLHPDPNHPPSPVRVFVRDISKGGCGLWSRMSFPQGMKLVVKFPGTAGGPPVQRIIEVCHCRGSANTGFAVGCRFVEADAEAA